MNKAQKTQAETPKQFELTEDVFIHLLLEKAGGSVVFQAEDLTACNFTRQIRATVGEGGNSLVLYLDRAELIN